ncbi:MAG: sigma factor-like helix-turn-helix DNA-binding protein [Roseiarcus sp.]
MTEPLAAATPLKPRRTARDRLVRRARIMERLREGRSYEEIAEAEGLSRERIRQIVVQALERREVEAQRDHAQLQMLRLAPALRLAAQGVAEGDRAAITALIRVLDRLDKYQAAGAAAEPPYDENPHERLMNKINAAAERLDVWPRFAHEDDPENGEGAPDEGAASQNFAIVPPAGLTP